MCGVSGGRLPPTVSFLELSAAAARLRGLPSGHGLPDSASPGSWGAVSPHARRASLGRQGAGRVGTPRRLAKTPAVAKPAAATAKARLGLGQAARGPPRRRPPSGSQNGGGRRPFCAALGRQRRAARRAGRTSTQEAARPEWAGPGRGTGSALSRTFLLPELQVTRLPEGLLPLQGGSGWPPEWMPHGVWVLIGLRSGQPLTKWPEGLSCLLGTPRHSHPTVIQAGTSCLSSAGGGGDRGGCQETPQGCLATARGTSCSTETRPEPGRAAHNSL